MKIVLFSFNKLYYSDFRVFFFNNCLEVSGKWGTVRKYLSFLLIAKDLFFISKIYFRLFITLLRDLIIGVTSRWFIELEMKGLGFKTFFSLSEKLYKIDLGYNHYIFYPISGYTLAVKTKKRSKFIIIYGIDKLEVLNFTHKLLKFRVMTSYKFRGIKFKDKALNLKVGKKKQFF